MDNTNVAIQITGLRKRYRLGTIGGGTLVGDLQSWWARKRGREDPNSKIGSRVYGKNEVFYALDGINLTICKGERIGIIGHNGAGKSTLLKLLSRVTAPTEGKICIDGRIASMLEVGTGFNGELTGRENVYLNGAILGMTKAEVDAKMEQIIDFSEVRQFIDTPVKRYSSGMYVKLAFSVAAHLDSEILIMDEVLAVGDMAFQRKCLDKMSQVSLDEGRTILYVSHNMNTIRQLCSRCIVMEHGKIIYNGDVEEAIDIYMKEYSKPQERIICFDDTYRPSFLKKHDISITRFELLDTDNYNFYNTGCLKFSLTFIGHDNIDDVCLRLKFTDKQNRGLANTVIKNICNVKNNEEYNCTFELKLKYFMQGQYHVTLMLYHLINNTDRVYEDEIILNAFSFKILPNSDISWDSKNWGCINFDVLDKIGD